MFLIVFLNQAWLVSPLLWVGTSQPCDSIAHLLIIKHQSNYHSSSLVAYPKTTANFLPREVFTQSSASLKCFEFPHFESCFLFFQFFFHIKDMNQSHGPHTCPLILRLLLGVWGAWKPPISGFNTLPETNVCHGKSTVLTVKNQERWEFSWATVSFRVQ